jgi:hypothetical protein
LPVARVRAIEDQLGSSAIAHLKTRGIGINSRPPPVAHGQTDTAFTGHVQPVETLLFSCDGTFWSIYLKVLLVAIEPGQPDGCSAFSQTKSHSLIA